MILRNAVASGADSLEVKATGGILKALSANYADIGLLAQVWIQVHDLEPGAALSGHAPLCEVVCFKGLSTNLPLPADGLTFTHNITIATSSTSGTATPTAEAASFYYAQYL